VAGTTKRKNNFREDPLVTTGSASLADYAGSGYDRGHLCPAADNTHSVEAMSESFYMSNMSPQEPGFNRGVWKRLESQFRKWTSTRDSIYVITGGVLTSARDTIGINRVTVPRYYYKIALQIDTDTMAIGFLLPNESSKLPLVNFVVPIDSIERITGIDFFYLLNNQEDFEAEIQLENWQFE
jgi:endonuclease G